MTMTIEPLRDLSVKKEVDAERPSKRTGSFVRRPDADRIGRKNPKNSFFYSIIMKPFSVIAGIIKIISYYISLLSRKTSSSKSKISYAARKPELHDRMIRQSVPDGYKKITVKNLLLNTVSSEKYFILDLRSLDDFFKDHIIIDRTGVSMNVPLDDLPSRLKELERFRLKRFLVYSYTDKESESAAMMLSAKGFDVTVLIGGYDAYKKELFN